ncbi:RNA polymerase sigma factor [Lentzea sp. JNUCC 0626]|uniref:RNA polymerase sigma factor n=1 Tax=Lentzea sp. JNUCC 0626 TaxID=3367513 RepID=UPI003747857A
MSRPRTADFDGFYRTELAALIAFLMKCGFSHHDAEDAAAEAMALAARTWSELTNPAAWVRTVAYRAACNATRRRRGEVTGDVPDSASAINIGSPAEQQDVLLWAMNQLPRTQRVVFVWYLDGFPLCEIAENLRMVESTVRSHFRHARAALKKLIDDGNWPFDV